MHLPLEKCSGGKFVAQETSQNRITPPNVVLILRFLREPGYQIEMGLESEGSHAV